MRAAGREVGSHLADVPDESARGWMCRRRSTRRRPHRRAGTRGTRRAPRPPETALAAARADLRLGMAPTFSALVTARDTERVADRCLDSLDAHVHDLRSRLESKARSRQSSPLRDARRLARARDQQWRRGTPGPSRKRSAPVLGSREAPIEPAVGSRLPPWPTRLASALIAEARARRPERTRSSTAPTRCARAATVAAAGSRRSGSPAATTTPARTPHLPRSAEWHDSWDVSVNVSWLLGTAAGAVRSSRKRPPTSARPRRAFRVRSPGRVRGAPAPARDRLGPCRDSAASDGVRSATEARRVVGERFRAGVATSTDMLDAEVAVLQAEPIARARWPTSGWRRRGWKEPSAGSPERSESSGFREYEKCSGTV